MIVAADELDRDEVVAQPAERPHRAREDRPGEDERDREPERVAGEQERSLQRGVGGAGEHEDRRQHGADARRRADRERAAEQHARAAAPRALHEPGTDEPLGPRQQAHEREPEDDEDEPCDPLEQELVAGRGPLRCSWAPTPSATKTAVKPSTNGMLASTTRRAEPRSPSRSASTAETAER